jgi:hypothetical protein
MHDQELWRRAHYDQDNNALDDHYVVPMGHNTNYNNNAGAAIINNFPAFSQRLRTMKYTKDFKPAIEKYDGRSNPSIWLKMYTIATQGAGGNEDHMVGYSPHDGPRAAPVAQ